MIRYLKWIALFAIAALVLWKCSDFHPSDLLEDPTRYADRFPLEMFDSCEPVAVGGPRALAIDRDGQVYSWGYGNSFAAGVGSDSRTLFVPIAVRGLPKNIRCVAAVLYYSIAVTDGGEVWYWGEKVREEQLLATTAEPARLETPKPARSVILTQNTISILSADGEVFSLGDNQEGQLGVGDSKPYDHWVRANLSGAVKYMGQSRDRIVIDQEGSLHYWGYGVNWRASHPTEHRRLGDFHAPKGIRAQGKFVKVMTQGSVSYALDTYGGLWSWGRNDHRRLTHDRTESGWIGDPTKIDSLSGVVDFATFSDAAYALMANGDIYTWGRTGFGRYGPDFSRKPERILRKTQAVRIYTSGKTLIYQHENGCLFARGVDVLIGQESQQYSEAVKGHVDVTAELPVFPLTKKAGGALCVPAGDDGAA